jgi:hypothetical protein
MLLNNDTIDADFREYESEDYFTTYYSDYENDDEYFTDNVLNRDSNQTDSNDTKGPLVLLNKVKTFPTRSPTVKMNAAFLELLQDLITMRRPKLT